MRNDDYSKASIVKNAWPEWTALEGGASARDWRFEFEDAPPNELISTDGLEDDDLQVKVHRGASPSELAIGTTTTGNARSDAIFFTAFYRLFERLETKFGRLRSIQGQPRDEWRPFR